MNDFPRRHQMQKWTFAERTIADAMERVESMGADVRLTDAVVLLGAARDRVADFVDHADGKRTVACQQVEHFSEAARAAPGGAALGTMTRYPEDLAAFLAEKLEAAWRAAPGGEPDSTRAPGAWGYCPICGKYLERLTGHHAKDGRPICVGALPAAEYRGAALGDEPRECRALLDEVVANFHDYIGQTVYGQDWVKRARTTLAASGGKATGTCHECGAPVRENGTWLDLSPRITYAPDGEAP